MITVILIAVVAILIASLVEASEASTSLPAADDLKQAKSRLVWDSVIGWISVILLVLLGGILLFGGEEILFFGSSALTYLILFALLALLSFSGWLTITATEFIGASSEYVGDKDRTSAINVAYQKAYLSSALSVGTLIALVLIVFAYYAGRWSVPLYY